MLEQEPAGSADGQARRGKNLSPPSIAALASFSAAGDLQASSFIRSPSRIPDARLKLSGEKPTKSSSGGKRSATASTMGAAG